jgi:hypothetical protein
MTLRNVFRNQLFIEINNSVLFLTNLDILFIVTDTAEILLQLSQTLNKNKFMSGFHD